MSSNSFVSKLVTFILAAPLSSCFSTSYPTPSASELEIGKSLTPPKGKGLVVVYRKPSLSMISGKVPTRAWIDGKSYGGNKDGSFTVIPVSPGRHFFETLPNPSDEITPSSFSFSASAGKLIFIRQSVVTGSSETMLVPAGTTLVPVGTPTMQILAEQVSDATGREEITKCKQLGGQGEIKVSTWP